MNKGLLWTTMGLPDGNLLTNAGDMRHSFDPWTGKIACRREWLPTLVFLSREFHGKTSLVGYSLWGCRVRHD